MLVTTVRSKPARTPAGRADIAAWAAIVGVVALTTTVAWGPVGLAIALVLTPAAAAADIDLRSGRLPDRLVLVAAAGAAALAAGIELDRGSGLVPALAGAAAMVTPLLVLHLVLPDAMGFGDVKLAAVLGAVIGLVDWRLAAVVLAVASGGALWVAAVRHRRTIVFGPSLVASTAAVLVGFAVLGGQVG